jgi:hypothetical protein
MKKSELIIVAAFAAGFITIQSHYFESTGGFATAHSAANVEAARRVTTGPEQAFSNIVRRQAINADPLDAEIRRYRDAAAQISVTPGEAQSRTEMIQKIAKGWPAQDSTGALEWAARLPDSVERKTALIAVCFRMAEMNPLDGIEAAERYGLSQDNGVIENLLQTWAASDAPAALGWANAQSTGEQRDQYLARIAAVESQTKPVDAALLVSRQISPGQLQTEAALSVLQNWAQLDLPNATAWAAVFPEGVPRERASRILAAIKDYGPLEQKSN